MTKTDPGDMCAWYACSVVYNNAYQSVAGLVGTIEKENEAVKRNMYNQQKVQCYAVWLVSPSIQNAAPSTVMSIK